MSRLVIGLGFRNETTAAAIGEVFRAALAQAGRGADAIAVPDDKASHPALRAAALKENLPILRVSSDALHRADANVATRSATIQHHRGVGSVCEAAALAGAGDGARLFITRIVAADRSATAAAALSKEPS